MYVLRCMAYAARTMAMPKAAGTSSVDAFGDRRGVDRHLVRPDHVRESAAELTSPR